MNKNNIVPATLLTNWCEIDQGHFGSVFRARHTGFQVNVAIKQLKGNVPQGLKELISEAEKMASASANPYVIRLYGIVEGHAQGLPGIVMEYMENGSLCTLMERVNQIPWALKFRILYEVTIGMNWLHKLPTPLLHLDLKTRNVLLTEDLRIKITDFGLSKYTRGSSTQEQEECEGVGGTLEYMPPEAFQEGYVPSTSTDVYSFAILSAVVLRGENPYPVDKSILVRELVPRGQRPCLQELEKETSVKYLKEATDFTKRCWDNDRFKRPHFSECCNKWEIFFKAFNKYEIALAVLQVQECLESSGKPMNVSYRQETTSVNTKDMSEMVHKLATMNFSENPQVQLRSTPIRTSNVQYQNTRVHANTVQRGHLQGASGSMYGPQFTYGPGYGHAMNSPSTPIQHSRIHPNMSPQGPSSAHTGSKYLHPTYQVPPQYWLPNFPGYQYPSVFTIPPPSYSNPTTVNISNSKNFQIGNNSIMNVTDKSYPGPLRNMMPGQSDYTTRSRYPAQMSPQQNQTTQGSHSMPARTVSGQPCKQETVNKSDQKSHICPTQAITEGHPSNPNPQQETQCNIPTTEDPTTKPPGQ